MPDSPAGRTPHRSPEGSFEVVLKSVLEDYAISADEFRVVMYLAAKPERNKRTGELWRADPRLIAYDLGWAQSRAERALRMLRRDTSYLREVIERKPNGRYGRQFSVLNRKLVIAPRTQ
jgi:hypothetical protein